MTTTTTVSITPEEAAKLWFDATDGYFYGEQDDEGNVEYHCAYRPNVNEFDLLVSAYEATKQIPFADMPTYDEADINNPWNVMENIRTTYWSETLFKPYEWVDGWVRYSNANRV